MNDNIFFIDIYDENANKIPLDNKTKDIKYQFDKIMI